MKLKILLVLLLILGPPGLSSLHGAPSSVSATPGTFAPMAVSVSSALNTPQSSTLSSATGATPASLSSNANALVPPPVAASSVSDTPQSLSSTTSSSQTSATANSTDVTSTSEFDLSKDQAGIPPPPQDLSAAVPRFATFSAAVANTPSYLPKPPIVSAEAGNRSVQLGWYPNDGPFPISGYLIYRGTDPAHLNRRHINILPVSAPEFLDNDENSFHGPRNKITYYYGVRAIDEDDRISPMSDLVSATPNGPLLPPGKFVIKPHNGRLLLQWADPISSGPNDFSAYQLYRSEQSGKYGAPYQTLPLKPRKFVDVVPNGQVYFYVLRTVDTKGNLSDPSEEIKTFAYKAVKSPQHLAMFGLGDEDIRLSWDASAGDGTYSVAGYNIYRSTLLPMDLSAPPINKLPVTGTTYEDDADNSTAPPKLGTFYHYRVLAMDERGDPSPAGTMISGSPTASLTGFSLKNEEIPGLGGGSALSIQGKKTVSVGYNNVSALGSGIPPAASGLQINQNLSVNLTGNVGSKIKVDVDYDDSNPNSSDQNISVVYTGDTQEVFKEFAFGDILMNLGSQRTEWADYNKSLFGAEVKMANPDDTFRLTAIGAQTKGFTETKRIVGGMESAMTGNALGREILDTSFIPFRYYYLSRLPALANKTSVTNEATIKPGSVMIYYDTPNQNALTNSSLLAKPGQNGIQYNFRLLVQGQDYLVDLSTGIVTFTNLNVGPGDSLAVAFVIDNANGSQTSVGYNSSGAFDFNPANLSSDAIGGVTLNNDHMIQNGKAIIGYDSHMSFQYYNLGNQNILNPQLDPAFKMYVYGTNQQSVYQLNPQTNFSNVVQFDTRLGLMEFTVPFPFQANLSTTQNMAMDPAYTIFGEPFPNNNADIYRYSLPMHNFSTHIEYKYQLASYTLRPGIIKGSDVITLDGRKLNRDTDYFLDDDSGYLSFANPNMITSQSVILATYEYTPFGGSGASTVWGVRGEYDLSKDLSIGSTFIDNSSSAPLTTPDIGSTPYDLSIFDGDLEYTMTRETVRQLLAGLTGDSDIPFSATFKTEVAHSTYNLNTYSQNNENGVAMVDDFESLNNVVSLSMQKEGIWEPSSCPAMASNGTDPVLPQDRRFDRIVNNIYQTEEYAANPNESPTRSMLEIDYQGYTSPQNWDSIVQAIPTSNSDLSTYTYLEIIVRSTSPVTLNMDIGQVNEDSNNNGQLDYETTGVFNAADDVGTWTAQNQGGTCHNPYCYPFPPGSGAQTYLDPNFWGADNNVVDTEDINHDGVLETTESFYRLTTGGSTAINGSNQWQVIDIPLNPTNNLNAQLIDGTGLRSPVAGNPNYYNNLQAFRLWWTNSQQSSGTIIIESISFMGSKWQTLTDPTASSVFNTQVLPDTNKIQAVPISEQSGLQVGLNYSYTPELDFFTVQVAADSLREQALQLQYNLTTFDQTNGVPNYFVQRVLGSGTTVDFGNYTNLRIDVFKPFFNQGSPPGPILPGEILLIRLGADDYNYMEYHVYLDSIPADGQWHTVTVALNGSDGNRTIVGTPYLRSVQVATLTIQTGSTSSNPAGPIPAGATDHIEFIRLDNLRATDAVTRQGTAFKVDAEYNLAGFKVDEDYRDIDSDFVQMDQQAVAPGRHQTSHSLSTQFSPVKDLNVTAKWETDWLYTESAYINDPLYSLNFSDPNHEDQIANVGVDMKLIPKMDVNSQGSWEVDRDLYLPAYIANERILTNDPTLDPDDSESKIALQQNYSLTVPKFMPVLKDDQFSFSWSWQRNIVDFDQQSALGENFTDIHTETAVLQGHYAGLYKPFSDMTIAPSYGVSETYARGTIQAPVVQVPYYTLNSDLSTGDDNNYVPQLMEFDPSLIISLDKTPFIHSPKISYNFKQTWDFNAYEVRTPGTLDASGTLALSDIFGKVIKLPDVAVTQEWSVNSIIDGFPRVRSQDQTTALQNWMNANPSFAAKYGTMLDVNGNTVTDPSTVPNPVWINRQPLLNSVWWVRLWENSNSLFDVDDIATSDDNRSTTNLSTTMDINPLPGWKGTIRPHFQYENDASMTQPEEITNQMQWSTGADLTFNSPPIPFTQWYNPGMLEVVYEYQNSSLNDVGGVLTDQSDSNDFTISLPRKATEALAIDLKYHELISDDNNYANTVGTGPLVTSKFASDPAVTANYVFHVDKTYKLWEIWPFDGRELRIKQDFELYNTLSYDYFSQSQPTIPGAGALGSEKYDINNRLKYDLLQNVEINFTLDNQWNYSFGTVPSNYYQIGISTGVSATF